LGQAEKKALKKHVLKSDSGFAEIYSCVAYNIKVNLNKNSTVNRDKPPEVGSYLADSVFANMMVRAAVDAMTELGCDWVDQRLASSLLDLIPNVDPADVGGLSNVQLNPLINREFTDEIKKREAQKYSEKYSTMYTCFKCKGKKTKEQEVQKRSLDEGGTLIVTCLICGNRWSP
jgi:DNA-directed RNA polymerase subunit M/transcription elongation factor TFIIS